MSKISAIQNIRTQNLSPEQQQKRKQNTEKAATVVGSTGFAATASRYASKRGLAGGESTLQQMMNGVTEAAKLSGKGVKEATGIVARFKKYTQMYAADFMKLAEKVKTHKYIAPLISSPITKKLAGGFGGVMAFFVLLTEGSKAVENGALAVNDIKSKYGRL